MKQAMTRDSLLSELSIVQQNRRDQIETTSELGWDGAKLTGFPFSYNTTDHSMRQISTYLGIPFSAMRKFSRDNGTTKDWNCIVDTLFGRHKDQKRLLRTTEDKLQAFVSTRFNVGYDAHRTYPTLIEQLNDLGLVVDSGSITDNYSYMKLLSPKIKGTILGQEVQFGLCHSTSDFGLARHRTDLLVFILSCLNGMVVSSVACTISRTHRGREMWINNDGELDGEPDPKKIREEMVQLSRDSVTMLQSDRLTNITEQINFIGTRRITDRESELYKLVKSVGVFYEVEEVIEELRSSNQYTVWGLSNAITSVAQTIGSYDRSVELEQLGWNVLKNPPQEYIPSAQILVEGVLN